MLHSGHPLPFHWLYFISLEVPTSTSSQTTYFLTIFAENRRRYTVRDQQLFFKTYPSTLAQKKVLSCVRINLEFVSLENVGSKAPVVLNLGTKLEWMVRFTPRPLYPRENIWHFPLGRRLVGPKICSTSFEGERHLLPPTIFNSFLKLNWR